MKKFMKKLAKKAEGFTLVELIVVIAILGILAAVAVPAYSGYITKANEAADITALSAIKTAAQASQAKIGAVDEIVVTTDSTGKITDVDINGVTTGTGTNASTTYTKLYDSSSFVNEDFKLYMNSEMPGPLKSDTFKKGAKWPNTQGEWYK